MCLEPADTVYYNAAASSEQGGSSLFGRIFQQQDFRKLTMEVSLTLERVFHGTFQTKDELMNAHSSSSNREQMAASNMITHERMDQVDQIIDKLQESANSIQSSQQHELNSCYEYIHELGQFEVEYTFWQVV